MNGTAILFALPETVIRHVLVGWLELHDISCLDSAFCTEKTRPAFLSLAYGDTNTYTIKNDRRAFSPEYHVSEQCAVWGLIRNARVDGISIRTDSSCDDSLYERFLAQQGRHIRWIYAAEFSEYAPSSILLYLARWCPCVREVCLRSLCDEPTSVCWDASLTTFTQACGLLDNLDLDSINTSTDGLARVLNACKNLKSLAIAHANCATPPEIALPTLCSITLRQCKATDDVMTAIASHCSQLQTLKVFDGNSITDVGVRAVLQGCPLLRETDVEYAHSISSELRVELAKRAQLKEVDFRTWARIDETFVQQVLRVSPGLTSITLSDACLSDTTPALCAQHCPLLEELGVVSEGNRVTSAGIMQLLKPGNRLRRVRLSGCTELGDEVILAFAEHCPLLRVMVCAELGLSDDAVVQLAQGCPELMLVDLKGTSVGDAGVTALATHCSGLRYLNLTACSNVTMHGVRALSEHCRNLTTLFLPSHLQTESLPGLKAPGAKVVVRKF
jgi:hypothetical protein